MSQSPQAFASTNGQATRSVGAPTGRNGAAGHRNIHDQRNDELSSLKKHFADDDLQSTEVRVLQEEGDHLSKLLRKAFPNDTRDTWSYNDLEDAITKSRSAWESKERIGHGKPQKLFHSLMRKFDSHSNLFQFIPSGNLYASIVTGATAVLVKASVNHSKTIEELSDALDAITEAVSLGDLESGLIRSKAMQSAVAKLYIAIFLFFGDAATWYKSSATSKVVHSLHKNFSERFKGSIHKIKELAANMRYIAQLGSQAEVRVVRLEVEGLQDELQDIRVGMSGRFRQLAEYLHAQHGENMKQHEKTQELLANYQFAGMLPAPPVAELDYQRLIQSTERLALPETEPVPIEAPASKDHESASTNEVASDESLEPPLSNQVWRLFESMTSEAADKRSNHPNLFHRPLAQAINSWLSKSASSILYLEYLASVPNEDTILALADQIIECCKSTRRHVVPRDLQFALVIRSRFENPYRRLVAVLLYLAYTAMSHDKEWRQSTLGQNWMDRLEKISITEAITILSAAIGQIVGRLYVVIPGHLFFAETSDSDLNYCIQTIRSLMEGPEVRLKVIILTPIRITKLVSCLETHELALLRQQPGKSKLPKMPIVFPPRSGS